MTSYEIVPLKSVGPLDFGMSPDQVREILGKPQYTVKQSEYSLGITDSFGPKGMTVHYDAQNTVAMVEFSGPEYPEFDGKNLLELEKPEEWIETVDEDAEIQLPMIISKKLGIAFYLPKVGLHSVSASQEGYYNEV